MPEGYLFISLSVDALEWTRHWLGARRCDLLTVFLAEHPTTRPQVRIVAVESKGRTESTPIQVRSTSAPFDEAAAQVVATLDALDEVLCPEASSSIFADLKLSALVEHLTSETLARLSPIVATDTTKLHVLSVLSSLSRRQWMCGEEIALEGLAVVTQRNATLPLERRRISIEGSRRVWSVQLARCGIPLIRELLEGAERVMLAPALTGIEPAPVLHEDDLAAHTTAEREESRVMPTIATSEALDPESSDRLVQLEAACKLRGFRIGEVQLANATLGPTLISVSVELAAGEALRPIQQAVPDIARELGVPSITVENDPARSYHIRFLLARAQRRFPSVPPETPQIVEKSKEHYFGLWLGAEVDGQPFRSYVSEWPHLLVAGTTGSGKTTFLKSLLEQLNGLPVGDVKLALVDGKGEYDYVDLVRPEHFATQFADVMLGHQHATEVLKWLVEDEVARRRTILREYFAANRDAPRAPRQAFIAARLADNPFPIAPVIVVIDEFAEIMLAAGQSAREFEDLIQRAVQAGRSALVHLLLATQRPDASVLPGAIKANMPSRVALALPSHHDSMTVLNSPGAEDLLGSGDLIFQSSTGQRLRLQGYRPRT